MSDIQKQAEEIRENLGEFINAPWIGFAASYIQPVFEYIDELQANQYQKNRDARADALLEYAITNEYYLAEGTIKHMIAKSKLIRNPSNDH